MDTLQDRIHTILHPAQRAQSHVSPLAVVRGRLGQGHAFPGRPLHFRRPWHGHLGLVVLPELGHEVHVLDTIQQDGFGQRTGVEHLVASPAFGRKQVKPSLFGFFPRRPLAPGQGYVSLDAFGQPAHISPLVGSCCELHELDIMDAREADAEVAEQGIRVVADVEEDFGNGIRFQNPFQGLAASSSRGKRLVTQGMNVD